MLLTAGVASAGGWSSSFTPGAAGAGDPYFPLDGNGGYDAKHYLLKVKYDPATDELEGKVRITARATQNLSQFNLDLEGLTVDSIRVNGWSRRPERDELQDAAPLRVKHWWSWSTSAITGSGDDRGPLRHQRVHPHR